MMMNRKRYSAASRNHPSWSWRSTRKPCIDRMARNRWTRMRPWAHPGHRSRAGAIASLNRRAKAGARTIANFSFGRR